MARIRTRASKRLFCCKCARATLAFVLIVSSSFSACGTTADPVTSTIQIGNSRIEVTIENGPLAVSQGDLLEWVQRAAESVATYYGRFPVSRVSLSIIPFEGEGVRGGKTFADGENAGRIRIRVGSETTMAELRNDWMLTHEMVHLAFPSMEENHHWIEEGIATYVEPIARVRAGHFDPSIMWAEVVRDLPQGLPGPDDQGLDHTHTWGRTYWGGALFCLLADVQIHQQTQNRKGLEDALRGILDAGGNISQDWTIDKALSIGDRATGVTVLTPLYEKMKDRPVTVDLDALWKQLGISREGGRAVFDESAPLAAIRKAITFGQARSSLPPGASTRPTAIIAGRH